MFSSSGLSLAVDICPERMHAGLPLETGMPAAVVGTYPALEVGVALGTVVDAL